MSSNWPKQSECDAFYGNPRGANGKVNAVWKKNNIIAIKPPFAMNFAGSPVTSVMIHKECARSLLRVFNAIWISSGHNQAVIDQWGVSHFGGSYNYRLMRGLNKLSMHAYGVAIDFDPARNGLGSGAGHLKDCPLVLDAFAQEGWCWGGTWRSRPDPMHFRPLA